MKLLVLDTSTEWCSAALSLDGHILARRVLAEQRHSSLLLPMVDELLREAATSLRELDGIGYGEGPGSFTGLRIACAVTQGLAFGADLPVAGVSTLESIAEQTGADRVLTVLDARMAEVYAGFCSYTDHEIGRLIQAVEDMGKLDNTLIIYISGDNGASAEGMLNGTPNEVMYFNGVALDAHL